jgi:hypothetical protein
MNIEDVTLGKLVVADLLFDSLTTYSKSLANFRSATCDKVDLTIQKHRMALLKWLNDWGCRNLSKDQHKTASRSILNWYQMNYADLLDDQKTLWKLEEHEIGNIAHAYGSLKDELGAKRTRYGNESEVHIGPTAASKILFAIMPKAIMPWDDAMRKSFGCDGSPQSYAKYLNAIKHLTLYIESLCRSKGFQIEDLPKELGRPKSTVIELVNEYIWITEAKEINLPSSEHLLRWASLG